MCHHFSQLSYKCAIILRKKEKECAFAQTYVRQLGKQRWGSDESTPSHQCGLGLNPGGDVIICELSLLLVLSLAPRGFSPGIPLFPSASLEPNTFNSNSIWNARQLTCLNHKVNDRLLFPLQFRPLKLIQKSLNLLLVHLVHDQTQTLID